MDPIGQALSRWIPRLVRAWRRFLRARGPVDELSPAEVQRVARAVRRLQQGLTGPRELVGAQYMNDPDLLGAYLLFYWPVSYAQGRHALMELPRRPRRALDLGSGPGPLAFACIDQGAEVVCADRSQPALDLGCELAALAGESFSARRWDPLRGDPVPEGEFDLVTMGHVLGELWEGAPDAVERRAALCEAALARVSPGGTLLVVEPALRLTSRALLMVRDRLVAAGHALRSPCLWRSACPALLRESDWCHAERSWDPPPLVRDIARAAGLRKETLKMTALLFAPRGEAWPSLPEGRLFRIVSEPLAGKGRRRYMGCGPEGRVGLSLQEKHLSDENALFADLRRGDVIRVENADPAPHGDGVRLVESTRVALVARAGRRL